MKDTDIREGCAQIYCKSDTFYNPAQKFNRDVTLAVINQYISDKDNPKIFEAMSATGIRGIRFIKELTKKCQIYLNDISPDAISRIKANLELNGIQADRFAFQSPFNVKNNVEQDYMPLHVSNNTNEVPKTEIDEVQSICNTEFEISGFRKKYTFGEKSVNALKSEVSLQNQRRLDAFTYQDKQVYLSLNDSNSELFLNHNRFDVVDIDPFGSCAQFIDSAVANIKDGGLLCLTSTDTSVLCRLPKKCYRKYNVMMQPTISCKEIALRILISCIIQSANKSDRSIRPLVSFSVDFYVRVFCLVSKKNPRGNMKLLSFYALCECSYVTEIANYSSGIKLKEVDCPFCEKKLAIIGPLYNGSLHDTTFISKIPLDKHDDRTRMYFALARNELPTFMYYPIPLISKYIKTSCIPIKNLVSALLNCGFDVSLTHCKENAVKTNASVHFLYYLAILYDKIHSEKPKISDKHRVHVDDQQEYMDSTEGLTNRAQTCSESYMQGDPTISRSVPVIPRLKMKELLFEKYQKVFSSFNLTKDNRIFANHDRVGQILSSGSKIGLMNSRQGPLSRPKRY